MSSEAQRNRRDASNRGHAGPDVGCVAGHHPRAVAAPTPRAARPPRSGFAPAPLLLAALVLGMVPAATAQDRDNCLFCHQYRGLSRYDAEQDRLNLLFVDPDYVLHGLGPHARLACTDCHPRAEVEVVPHRPVTRVSCTQTCHLQDPGGLERRYTHAPIAETLARSVHPPELLARLQFTGGPLLLPNQSECLYCHDEPLFRDPARTSRLVAALGPRTFDRCDVCHGPQLPVDVGYYLRHVISRIQPARPTLELAQVCAVCHSDPEVLRTHELRDAVASYVRSFHGKAALLGDESTANCISCHVASGGSAHLMLAVADPHSAVAPQRVANSCRTTACHPGADKRLAAAAVHVNLSDLRGTLEYALAVGFVLFTIITFGPSMTIVVLELFAIVIGRQHHGAHELERLTQRVWAHPEGRRKLTRFTPSQRVQHWVLALLFTLLALTGFPMKFADQAWARVVIDLFGGLAVARQLHHWGGLLLVAGLAFHLLYVLWTMQQRRRAVAGRPPGLVAAIRDLPMWVNPIDLRQTLHLLAYLLHLRPDRPVFDRFNPKEKFEYFGVFWGTVLLGVTGALLWGEQIASRFFSGRLLNLALIAHTYEAFLAVIHVGILHLINVMLHPLVFPLSPATITGRTPTAVMAEEHTGQVLRAARELGISTEAVTHE